MAGQLNIEELRKATHRYFTENVPGTEEFMDDLTELGTITFLSMISIVLFFILFFYSQY